MKYNPWPYQEFSTNHILKNPYVGLFMDMGLGKTISTLDAVDQLMFQELEVSKVLVIAPKRVAEATWVDECKKWTLTRHLKLSVVLGTERQRKEALKVKADIYTINRENVAWLVGYYQSAFPFDTVVIDELSSFKSPTAIRFKALRRVRPLMRRVIGLTGTPAPNSLVDLWAQIYLLDQGERLGKFVTDFKDRFFDYNQYTRKYTPKPGAEQQIYDKISDICISMKAKDYLDLPERINRTVEIRLPTQVQERYEAFEREQVLALENLEEITAVNAAALSTKLLQFANGAIYDEDKNWHELHQAKLDALDEIVEVANGQPVLILYSYRHDFERISKKLKAYKPRKLEGKQDIQDWNEKKIQVLLAHPASGGHGLNLQAGGNIVIWFGLNWALELYQQANARLDRQGQTKPVIIHHLVVKDTMDEDVIISLDRKRSGQDALMNAVKARISKYRKIKNQII